MVKSQVEANPVYTEKTKDGVTEIKVLPKQRKIVESRKRVVVAIGGVQSGKTYAALMGLATVIANNPGERHFLLAPSFGQLEAAAIPKLKSITEALNLYDPTDSNAWNKSSHELTFTNGAKLRYFSASNPERFQSVTTPGVMIDEISEVPERLIDIALQRVAVMEGTVFLAGLIPHPNQLISHWIYDRIYKPYQEGDDDIELATFSSKENPFFSDDRYYKAKEEMPEPVFRAEYKGEFVESLLSDNVFVPTSVNMAQRRWKRRMQYLPKTLHSWLDQRAKVDLVPNHKEEDYAKAQGAYLTDMPDQDNQPELYKKWRKYRLAYGQQKGAEGDESGDYEQSDPEAGILKYGIDEEANDLLIGPEAEKKKSLVIGVDVADEGQDESVLTVRWYNTVIGQRSFVCSTDKLEEHIMSEIKWFKQRDWEVSVWVDAPGLGKAVANNLRANNVFCNDYWPSDSTPAEPRRYLNLKSWVFFQMRKRILYGVEAIPEERSIRRQVLSQSYESTDKDKIKISKDKHNSFDYCDSYIISLMGVDKGLDPSSNVFFV